MLELTVELALSDRPVVSKTPLSVLLVGAANRLDSVVARLNPALFRKMLSPLDGRRAEGCREYRTWEVAQQQPPRRLCEPLLSPSQERRLPRFYTTARIRIAAVMMSTGLQTGVLTG
jgi:hypothetical protein